MPPFSTEIKRAFGEGLRKTRLAKGMTQAQLSEGAEIAKPSLSRYENGHVLPSMPTFLRLAHALGIDPDDLASVVPGWRS